MFEDSTILVTGGTGSFGQFFVKTILKRYRPRKIIIFSRDEDKQAEMARQEFFRNARGLRFFLGDIRDRDRLIMAMRTGVDFLVHAAALKHVPLLEYNPFEAIKTNILGSQNVIEAAITTGVGKTIALSTDKASSPINLYGATKLATDKLFVAANKLSGSEDSRFSIVRYGNVFGSRGSVVPFFLQENIGEYFPITDPRMTRFNITLQQGVDFVIDSFKEMHGGELFVPKLPAYKITDLATAIDPKKAHKVIGRRAGEKIHEELISSSEWPAVVEREDSFVIKPQELVDGLGVVKTTCDGDVKADTVNQDRAYTSDNVELLSMETLRGLIKSYKASCT